MTKLHQNEHLHSNSRDRIDSKNADFTLKVQPDGNLVIYSGHIHTPDRATFSSGTYGRGHGPFRLTMQEDGNLVLYDHHNQATWASNTDRQGIPGGYTAILKNNGQLVVKDIAKQTLFSSKPINNKHLLPSSHCC